MPACALNAYSGPKQSELLIVIPDSVPLHPKFVSAWFLSPNGLLTTTAATSPGTGKSFIPKLIKVWLENSQ